MTKLTMSAYASSVRDDPEPRARMGIAPDAIMHLPRHWAICRPAAPASPPSP